MMDERERELLAQIAARGVRLGTQAHVSVGADGTAWLNPDNPFVAADDLTQAGYDVLFDDWYEDDGSMFYTHMIQLSSESRARA